MSTLGCLLPTEIPHATAFIDQMVELISELVALGAGYETSDGVYFTVSAVSDYGLLAHQSLDSMRSGARVEVNEEKRSPLDFALWKKAKPPEPWWPSPWGPGRPGWHTECVVMSLALLGEGFDLHGGGQDLIFPHHENERAQSVAVGQPVCPPLDAQRDGGGARGREDVEVARQRAVVVGPVRPDSRSPRLPLARAAVALPGADRGDLYDAQRRRSRLLADSTP